MSKVTIVLYFMLTFLAGVLAAQVWDDYSSYSVTGAVVDTPSDSVEEKKILIYDDKVVLLIENASMSNYDSTGSMEPTLGEGVNGIKIVPKNEEEINVGDIVSFNYKGKIIVHRVVEIGLDEKGKYFVTKGDNSDRTERIRFEDIKYKTVALIY